MTRLKSITVVEAIIAAIILGVVFFMVDCSMGKTQYFECNLNYHHYDPPHTETTTSTDSNGHLSISTTDYPEEFHLICASIHPDYRTIDAKTDQWHYQELKDGQKVWLRVRCGRWTGGSYMAQIIDNPPVGER